MKFSVIYSFDIEKELSVSEFQPPQHRTLWTCTEGDEGFDYDYLGYENGKHRKYCAILDKEQFIEFIEHCQLTASDVETMGSLGAPGFGVGWAPAISFDYGDSPYRFVVANAYVTPLPEPVVERKDGYTERDWDRLKEVIVGMFS